MEHWEADAVLERSTGFVYDLTFEGNHFFSCAFGPMNTSGLLVVHLS